MNGWLLLALSIIAFGPFVVGGVVLWVDTVKKFGNPITVEAMQGFGWFILILIVIAAFAA